MSDTYGLLARFAGPAELVRAAQAVRDHGYRNVEGYSPYRVEGLADALGHSAAAVRWVVLAAGIAGGAGGLFMQYYTAVHAYPLNIAGRPLNSWPAFVPVTFELTILAAALGAVLGMLLLNGLPMPYHPVFNVPAFVARSSTDFFLAVRADDPRFEVAQVRALLAELGAAEVHDVAP